MQIYILRMHHTIFHQKCEAYFRELHALSRQNIQLYIFMKLNKGAIQVLNIHFHSSTKFCTNTNNPPLKKFLLKKSKRIKQNSWIYISWYQLARVVGILVGLYLGGQLATISNIILISCFFPHFFSSFYFFHRRSDWIKKLTY